MTELDLVSDEPVPITIGDRETRWDVAVTVAGAEPPLGSMTVTKTGEQGGTFSSEIRLYMKLTFTPHDRQMSAKVLDTASAGMAPVVLSSTEPVPWISSAAGLRVLWDPDREFTASSNFIPGVELKEGQLEVRPFKHWHPSHGHFVQFPVDLGPGPVL
ncbi:MAG: hypothetical protein GY856_35065 [bacterium]|nr:hypothetical protein [bacterium]